MIKSRQKNWKNNNAIKFQKKVREENKTTKNPFQEINQTIISKRNNSRISRKKTQPRKHQQRQKALKKNNKSKNIHENYVFVWFFPISKHKLSFWSNNKSNIIKILYFNFWFSSRVNNLEKKAKRSVSQNQQHQEEKKVKHFFRPSVLKKKRSAFWEVL